MKPELPFSSLPKLPKVTLLRAVHWAAHQGLVRAGYRWELRRGGELKLGLWRKDLAGEVKDSKPRRKGSPRRLVVVPGFADTPLSWLPILLLITPSLRRRFDEIVLVDFPGFNGFLAAHRGYHSMDLLIGALGDAFDSLRPHTILGHSLGGWMTARYAAACGAGTRPARKQGSYTGPEEIVLINPAGAFANDREKERWKRFFEEVLKEGLTVWRPHLFAKEPGWFKLVAPDVAGFFGREEVRLFIESVRDEHFIEEELPKVKARTWLLWGEDDTLIPATAAPVWARKLPNLAGAYLLRKIGHTPQAEGPVLTAALLRRILLGKSGERLLQQGTGRLLGRFCTQLNSSR